MLRSNIMSFIKKNEPDGLHFASSKEAQICLNCTAKKCRGDCKRAKEERKKLKELQNDRV